MKIPRKVDLINLQNIYKTDARIAEALGGVQEYLVAYWRRKKGVPPYSAPKFSQQQIAELWERYGDDFRCGRELNISKAAFYSWRRKYDILERPAVLRLEQLELRLSQEAPKEPIEEEHEQKVASEKIEAHCRERWPRAPHPADLIVARRGSGLNAPVGICPGPMLQWPRAEPTSDAGELGPISDREPVWCLPGRGSIVWQLVEGRTVLPGQLVRGDRTILGGCGGVGALVLDAEDRQEPRRVVRVELTRRLPLHADVEDIVLTMLAHGWIGGLSGAVVEYSGGPVERLSVDRKVRLCSLTVAIGAYAALCSFDDIIRHHYGRLLQGHFPQCHPDRGATYDGEHFVESRGIEAQIGMPDSSGVVRVASPRETGPGGVLVGPEALPYEIESVAALVAGRSLRNEAGQGLLVCPATPAVYRQAQRRGWAQAILDAGGSILDVALTRRLGMAGLAALAAGNSGDGTVIYCTQFPSGVAGNLPERFVFSGVRAALAGALLAP